MTNENNFIQIYIKEAGKEGETRYIYNELDLIQKLIGGYVEEIKIGNDFVMLVDEESKVKGKERNFYYKGEYIRGTAIFCNMKGFEFDSLSSENLDHVMFLTGKKVQRAFISKENKQSIRSLFYTSYDFMSNIETITPEQLDRWVLDVKIQAVKAGIRSEEFDRWVEEIKAYKEYQGQEEELEEEDQHF
jgi:hypothetical protein